jgi:hypothetical protein
MKKIIQAIFLLFAGIGVFAQSGVIKELSGTVELKPSGASSFVAANSGDLVREDTLISTGFKSTALVELGSAIIVVRPLTRLTLTEIRSTSGTETLNVNLQAGRVRVDVNPPAGLRASMTVQSPSATASVRGTSFELDVKGIYVLEGVVSYQGIRGSPVNVYAGLDSAILKDGPAANPHLYKIAGYPPSAPVGYDPTSSSSSPSGITAFYTPAANPDPVNPGGPGEPGSPGPGPGPGPGPDPGPGPGPGPSGSDGDIGGIIVDSW